MLLLWLSQQSNQFTTGSLANLDEAEIRAALGKIKDQPGIHGVRARVVLQRLDEPTNHTLGSVSVPFNEPEDDEPVPKNDMAAREEEEDDDEEAKTSDISTGMASF